MKILLVEPDDRSIPGLNFGRLFIMEPLSLELIAASVPEHEVKIVDLRLDPFALEYYLDDFKPDVIGVTGITALHNEINKILAIGKGIGAFTIAGGPHASFAYQALANIDAVVIGEGEGSFRKLISVLNSSGDLSLVPNLVWRDRGKWIRNDTYGYNLWPLPRRDFANDYKYTAIGHPTAMVEATRGCPHRCSFCVTPKLFRGRYRVRPVEEIVNYISTRPEPFIMFPDADFLASAKYITSLLEGIRKAKLKKSYMVAIRADEIVSNPKLIEMWSHSGLSFAFIGFEGYKQEQLNSYHKDSLIDYNKKAVSILHKSNVMSIGTMLVNPDWAAPEFDKCLAYAKRLGSDITFFSVLTPFPGTEIAKGYPTIATYDKFDVLHAVTETALPYQEFQRNFVRISKLIFRSRATIGLFWRLLKRKLLKMDSFLSFTKIFNYIATIDKKLT